MERAQGGESLVPAELFATRAGSTGVESIFRNKTSTLAVEIVPMATSRP
jgi:hypothetical protein